MLRSASDLTISMGTLGTPVSFAHSSEVAFSPDGLYAIQSYINQAQLDVIELSFASAYQIVYSALRHAASLAADVCGRSIWAEVFLQRLQQ